MSTVSPQPFGKATLVLENDDLTVEIAAPGRYAMPRFCWGGFVVQVFFRTEGKSHTFCVSEVEGEGARSFSGGAGLCNEFGLREAIGYEEARMGEWFPKLGVGLLRRYNSKEYGFYHDYEIDPFDLEVRESPGQIRFISLPKFNRGYATRLEQMLTVKKNRLTIDYRLENLGEKSISTREYRHNFLALDGMGPGPGAYLRLPFTTTNLKTDGSMIVIQDRGQTVVQWSALSGRCSWSLEIPPGSTFGNGWEMEWTSQGVGMREETSQPVTAFQIYATPKLMSPEAFVDISVAPGEIQEWKRTYTFFALPR